MLEIIVGRQHNGNQRRGIRDPQQNILAAESNDTCSNSRKHGGRGKTDPFELLVAGKFLFAQADLGAALYNYGAAAKTCFTAEKIVDLGTLDGDYTAQDGDVLTGTLAGDYKITVADGANVTLKDADVTCLTEDASFAAITPLGDAAITIEGTNTVKGGDEEYPGIYVPKDKTLTIGGAGSLKADSGGYGCGIGGGERISAGNIMINGSTITADGGESVAGIGSGPEADCGDIVISGGTVTAVADEHTIRPGIGSGNMFSSCGNVLIKTRLPRSM